MTRHFEIVEICKPRGAPSNPGSVYFGYQNFAKKKHNVADL